jgi:hypothetical protein
MNPPPSSKRPPLGRLIRIAAVTALLAALLTYALRNGKPKAEPSPVAKPLENLSIPLDAAQPETAEKSPATPETEGDPRGLARVEALRSIGDDLTSDESTALLTALLTAREPSAAQGSHSVWFHETALALHRQAAIREPFARTLATVARDTARDPVIRDYALQHLCQLWQNSERQLADSIQATLLEIADQSPAMAPSALLALHFLGTQSASGTSQQSSPSRAVPDDRIAPRVRSLLATDAATSTAAQMTALRIVGERRLPGFHHELQRIAADPVSGHTLVRMAAVAAIASFADPRSLPLLRDLERSDPRVATAIDHAIARIESIP